MINAEYNGKNGHKLTVTGHAGAAPKGEDLVCAAVTILVRSLAEYMKLTGDAETTLSDGKFKLKSGNSMSMDSIGALHMVLIGLDMLAQQYPEYINFSIKD